MEKKRVVLVIDDDPVNVIGISSAIEESYKVIGFTSGIEALEYLYCNSLPSLILLDIRMPDIDGYTLLCKLKENSDHAEIPVIMVTASGDEDEEERVLTRGVSDFIRKPIRKRAVLARINNQIELKEGRDLLKKRNNVLQEEIELRVKENLLLQEVTLTTLVALAETRDTDTGNHIIRTMYYCRALFDALSDNLIKKYSLDSYKIDIFSKAAQLHDIGKIGIPDSILLKRGKLDSNEFEIMKTHCVIGSRAITNAIERGVEKVSNLPSAMTDHSLDFLNAANSISLYHHEKWDGSGYPKGLKGDEIPIEARIMAIADVFDALISKRVYKEPIDLFTALNIIKKESGVHFDPELVVLLVEHFDKFIEIQQVYGENNG